MKIGSLSKIPWLSLVLLWLAYILVGWYLSSYHIGWSIFLLVAVDLVTIASLWGGKSLWGRVRLGPQSLILILLFSGTVCLAATLPSLFALTVMVLAAQLLARVDLLSAGLNINHARWILTVTTAISLGLGWIVGLEESLPTFESWSD